MCFVASNKYTGLSKSCSSCLRSCVPCAFRGEQTGSDSAGSISGHIVLSGVRSGGSNNAVKHRENLKVHIKYFYSKDSIFHFHFCNG